MSSLDPSQPAKGHQPPVPPAPAALCTSGTGGQWSCLAHHQPRLWLATTASLAPHQTGSPSQLAKNCCRECARRLGEKSVWACVGVCSAWFSGRGRTHTRLQSRLYRHPLVSSSFLLSSHLTTSRVLLVSEAKAVVGPAPDMIKSSSLLLLHRIHPITQTVA